MLSVIALVAMFAPTPWCQARPDSRICKRRCEKDPESCPVADPGTDEAAGFDVGGWDETTVGFQLNEHFRRFRETCNLVPPREGLSSIPRSLSNEISPTDPAVVLTRDSGGEAFLRLFDADDLVKLADRQELGPLTEPKKRIVVQFGEGELLPAPSGASNVAYVQSCASLASADAELGVKWGSVELNSALKAESNNRSEIIVIEGAFFSPVEVLLNGNATEKRAALLALWASRRNFSPTQAAGLLYMKGFDGVLILRSASRAMNTKFNIAANAEASFSAVKAEIAAEAGFERASDLSFARYSSHIRHVEDDFKKVFANLPTIQRMKESAMEGARSAVSHGTTVVTRGANFPVRFEKVVLGIPAGLCSKEEWLLDSTAVSEGLTVNKTEVDVVQSERFACRFVVQGTLKTQATATSQPKPISTTFAFIAGTGDVALRIPFETTVNTSDDPRPELPQGQIPSSQQQDGGSVEYRWRVQLRFSGEDFRANYSGSPPTLKRAELRCPESQMTLEAAPEIRQMADKRGYTVEIASRLDGATADHEPAAKACEFSAEVVFPIINKKGLGAGVASRFLRIPLGDYRRKTSSPE